MDGGLDEGREPEDEEDEGAEQDDARDEEAARCEDEDRVEEEESQAGCYDHEGEEPVERGKVG